MECKNCDKQIAFIVRVMSRRNVRFQDKRLVGTENIGDQLSRKKSYTRNKGKIQTMKRDRLR
jgi:hypothetical protein